MFRPSTQQYDPTRSRTQTSRREVRRINRSATASPTLIRGNDL